MGSNSLGCKANFTQTINFKGSETEYSAEIIAQDVTISCSAGDHRNGSSKVKLKNVVDYNWELKYYVGELIASHVDGKVYAYTLKPKGKFGMFRVVNTETDHRTLIKDLKGTIQDISFALTPQVILGCIDEEGNLYIYSVDENETTLTCTLLMHVVHPREDVGVNYRVIWCPYIPTFGEDSDTIDDPAKLLVLLNGTKAEVWDVSVVNSKYGTGPLEPLDEYDGYVEINGHTMDVIDASFSPDGTALATAALDGYVKFFQVYMIESEDPRCLHHWQPHDGKALSSLLFLDNVKSYGISDSKFWKFAITGANHNAELKIWSCESWTCLQTIRFEPNPHCLIQELYLKVCIDMSADYLMMSDINNRILYILQIQKNEEDRLASVSTISEFLLPASILSFAVLSVTPTNVRYTSTDDLYEDGEDFDEDTNITAIAMKMIVVQPKSLQECTVTFKPEGSIASNIKTVYGNVLEVTEGEEICVDREELPKLNDLQSSVTLLIQQQTGQHLNLMTPEDFNSPVVNSSPNNIRNSLVDSPSPPIKNESVASLIDFQQPQKDNCASGGSSPSREVQEILALNNPAYDSQEFFENLKKLDIEPEIITSSDYKVPEGVEVATSDNGWPNIPMMKAIEIEIKEESRRKLNEEDDKIQALSYRLLNLESLIKKQNEQIHTLQQEMKMQNGKKSASEYDIRSIFVEELGTALDTYQSHTKKLFDAYVKDQRHKERDHYENLIASISLNLTKQISEHLQNIICHEIKLNILPPILGVFEKLQLQLDVHYSQKLNTIDQLLKTNISKLFNNKIIADSLSSSIINVIKPSLENCYKDMISSALIPSWERVCNNMFQQINTTFTQGTKEYTSSVESYMERQRKVQDKGKDLITQIQSVADTMRVNAEKLSNNISDEMQQQITICFNNMQDKLAQMITDLVKEQVKISFRTHAAVLEDSVVNAVRSRAVTPSPHVFDTQVQITQLNGLIMKGNIDIAFQQALSASATASDLSLVLYVCERVNPYDVFGSSKCILQQHVLLSLIQQLSADLTNQTEVKQRYLQEAILNLETLNPVTREHVPIVLSELMRQLKIFIAANPSHKNITNMRMLLMATKALIK